MGTYPHIHIPTPDTSTEREPSAVDILESELAKAGRAQARVETSHARIAEILAEKKFEFVHVERYLASPDVHRDIKGLMTASLLPVSFEDAGEFLADEHVSPFVRADVAMRLMRVSFRDVREFLANEDIDATVRVEVAVRLADTPFAEAEGFLKEETIVFAVRMEVAKRLMQHPPIAELEASGFLRNKKIPLPIRVRVATDAQKSRLSDGMKGLLDDPSVHTAVRDAVAGRVWRTRGKKRA